MFVDFYEGFDKDGCLQNFPENVQFTTDTVNIGIYERATRIILN